MSFPIAGLLRLVLLASITAAVALRLHVLYTATLALVGVLVSTTGLLHDLRPSGEAILLLFLPPIVFETAFHVDLAALGRGLPKILILAIPSVVVSAILVKTVLSRPDAAPDLASIALRRRHLRDAPSVGCCDIPTAWSSPHIWQ